MANVLQARKTDCFTRVCRAAEDFFFPALCVVCDEPREYSEPWLCAACLKKLTENHEKRDPCLLCGQNLRSTRCACEGRATWSARVQCIYSLFDFDPLVKDLLHQIKYRGRKRLAVWLAAEFGSFIPGAFWTNVDAIVPVPLHPRRLHKRGYNQSLMLAQGLSHAGRILPVLEHVLRRTRNTATQTALNRDERSANMAGAFAVAPQHTNAIAGKRLLLIDDVVTTGATTDEAAGALLTAGCAEVRVISIARD